MRLGVIISVCTLVALLLSPVAAQTDEDFAWSAISDSQSAYAYRDFASAFPRGKFVREARLRYSRLAGISLPPGILKLEVAYPEDARALPFSVGSRTVVLDVLVEADGTPGMIKVTKRSGFDPMDRAAVGAARRALYLPAVENGMAVDAHLPFTIDFSLTCPGEYSLVSCKDGEFR